MRVGGMKKLRIRVDGALEDYSLHFYVIEHCQRRNDPLLGYVMRYKSIFLNWSKPRTKTFLKASTANALRCAACVEFYHVQWKE